MNIKITLLLTILSLGLTNCASIVSKSNYPVTITSENPVNFKIQNSSTGQIVHVGKTPSVANLQASNGWFKPAQYSIITQNNAQSLNATLDGWYFGNIPLLAPILGMLIIDPATGAMWQLPPQCVIGN